LPRACPPTASKQAKKAQFIEGGTKKKFHNIINIYRKCDEEECEEVKERVAKVVILHLENTMSICGVDMSYN
jgi:hypothetical protein